MHTSCSCKFQWNLWQESTLTDMEIKDRPTVIFRWQKEKMKVTWQGTGAHTCNPSTLGGYRHMEHKVRSLRPAWPTWWNSVSTKNTKISQVRLHVPVISATREAEAGESLEPGRRRLLWAETAPTFQPGWQRETPSLEKPKQNKENKKNPTKKKNRSFPHGLASLQPPRVFP